MFGVSYRKIRWFIKDIQLTLEERKNIKLPSNRIKLDSDITYITTISPDGNYEVVSSNNGRQSVRLSVRGEQVSLSKQPEEIYQTPHGFFPSETIGLSAEGHHLKD